MSVTGTETFGQRVRRLREKQGVRQIDLAAKAGLSWRHLIRIEQDTGGATKQTTVLQLAEALGVEPSELTAGDDDDEESDPAMLEAFVVFVDLMGRLQSRAQQVSQQAKA